MEELKLGTIPILGNICWLASKIWPNKVTTFFPFPFYHSLCCMLHDSAVECQFHTFFHSELFFTSRVKLHHKQMDTMKKLKNLRQDFACFHLKHFAWKIWSSVWKMIQIILCAVFIGKAKKIVHLFSVGCLFWSFCIPIIHLLFILILFLY